MTAHQDKQLSSFLKTVTLLSIFAAVSGVFYSQYAESKPETDSSFELAFKEPAYLEARRYTIKKLVKAPLPTIPNTCIDAVAFTLADMPEMAEQYTDSYPDCVKALLAINKLRTGEDYSIK